VLQYNCVNGQSWSDVCLNTYGSMDLYIKFLNDNALEPNSLPYSGEPVQWDNALTNNQTTSTLIRNNSIIFCTLTGYGVPVQQNPTMSLYNDVQPQVSYTASTSGETIATITALQGNSIIQVIKEIKPLKPAQYSFNSLTGTITLLGGESLAHGETLFVTYKKQINTV
jgi:hypothetical protein